MSVSEPNISGKVILKTTLGDIEIELWAKEAPLAVRNFVQLCLERYYDNCIFHRVIKDFIAQTGDPTGTGTGGESIYKLKDSGLGDGSLSTGFNDEFHSRLRFNRRGLVGMASSSPDQNKSQFFFTLAKAENLTKKHTLFGRVVGDTLFNLLKVNDIEVDKDTDMPLFPPKILTTEVVWNPFDDIIPREKKQEVKKQEKKKLTKKNLGLLSFGDEEEQDDKEEFIPKKNIKNTNDLDKEKQKQEKEKRERERERENLDNNNGDVNLRDKLNSKSSINSNNISNNSQNSDSSKEEEEEEQEQNKNNSKSFSDKMKEDIIKKGLMRQQEKESSNNTTTITSTSTSSKPVEKKKKVKGSLQFKATSAGGDPRVLKKPKTISDNDLMKKLDSFKASLNKSSSTNNNNKQYVSGTSSIYDKYDEEEEEKNDENWKGHSLSFSKKSKLEYE